MRKHLLIISGLLAVGLFSACEGSAPSLEGAPAETPPLELQETASPLSVTSCRVLPATAVSASGDDGDGSVAANTQDDDLDTRWSDEGKGSWLLMDLGSVQPLEGATVAWYRGDQRRNKFIISTSEDGKSYSQAYAATSARTTAAQTYPFSAPRRARYVRITVNGNDRNDWASIAETRACGEQTSTPPPSTPPPSTPPPSTPPPSTPPPSTPPSADSGPALPRQPYLQSVGQTSAIVAFRTGVSCTPFVRYGPGTDVSRTATASKAGWQHAVLLTGLTPGQTYSYVVEGCGSVTGARQFRTAPPATATRLRFTAMGDFGTGGDLQKNVLSLLSQPGRAGELLLALGDNAYSKGSEQEFQEHMFAPMAALLRQVPLFPVLGNHEYGTDDGQPYLDNFYLPANNPRKTERYYSFDWGPVHFVALDSSCAIRKFEPEDCTPAEQRSWAAQDLAATRQPWKVVFFHHPLWSSGSHGSEEEMRSEFAPLFEEYGVDLVLTGHDHNYERSKPMRGDKVAASGTQGITYVVVGSGGAELRKLSKAAPDWAAYRNNTDMGYLEVAIDGGTLAARFYNPRGEVKDSFTVTKTLPASVAHPARAAEPALETPPGPVDDPAHPPAGLRFEKPLPPAESLEATADEDEP